MSVIEAPSQPANRVHGPHGNIDDHIVAVVKVDESHVVDVPQESNGAGKASGSALASPLGAKHSYKESGQREGDDREGTEVVHHFGEVVVSCVKDG